jgi:hypothetical protein
MIAVAGLFGMTPSLDRGSPLASAGSKGSESSTDYLGKNFRR